MVTRVTKGEEAIKRARDEIEKRTGKTAKQLYAEREKSFMDVIELKVPDRMPVFLKGGYFAIRYAGLPISAIFYDPAACIEAILKVLLDFEPDIFLVGTTGMGYGLAMEKLSPKQFQWPGYSLRADLHSQFVDMETMKEDEYDLFIADPGDFVLRYYLPRAYGAMEPLSKMPSLRSLVGQVSLEGASPRFSPEIIKAFEAILKAGQEHTKMGEWPQEIGPDMGCPPIYYPGGNVVTPFDVIADYFRGMTGIAVDMFNRPDKLHAAMDRILEWNLPTRAAPTDPKERGKRRVQGGGLHFSSSAFLSRKQYDTFYWPTWKKSLTAAIDRGFVPVMGCQISMEDRLDCFLELPKGKAILWNDMEDMARAKEILGGHMAIMGGMPASLLHFGSPQEVEEYCKNIIKVAGKGGGFILCSRSGEDDAKPENLKAMVDAVRKYGRYE